MNIYNHHHIVDQLFSFSYLLLKMFSFSSFNFLLALIFDISFWIYCLSPENSKLRTNCGDSKMKTI